MISRRACAGALCAAIGLAGCASGSQVVVRTPTGSPPSAPASTAASPTSGSPTAAVHPRVRIVPARGLRDGQRVRVVATGFSPGKALQIVQCADKGQRTGPGDCNISAMLPATADASGRVSASLEVTRGPFGGNSIVCSATQRCLISVTEASLTPTEEANAEIRFAG